MNDRPMHPVPALRRPLVHWPLAIVTLVAIHALVVGCGGSPPQSGESAPASGVTEVPAAEVPASEPAPGTADPSLGARVYAARCALCHGAAGSGDGPAAAGLNPKPRAHTDKAYMSTLTDEQIMAVIRNGKGTMPAWGKVLNEAELVAVAAHVRSLAK